MGIRNILGRHLDMGVVVDVWMDLDLLLISLSLSLCILFIYFICTWRQWKRKEENNEFGRKIGGKTV
jgi:hypothetical protein